MSATVDRLLGSIVERNNRRIDDQAAGWPNPRPVESLPWHHALASNYPTIRDEWDTFVGEGGRLPRIDDLLGEQIEVGGTWRAGLLCAGTTASELALRAFPETLALVQQIPRLQAALLSYLEPHTDLLPHHGPNSGVLRYHLGVDCPPGAALTVDGVEHPYCNGEGILFSDRSLHSASNPSDRPRITLFCELEADAVGSARLRNEAVQAVLRRDPRRWMMLAASNSWDRNLNRCGRT